MEKFPKLREALKDLEHALQQVIADSNALSLNDEEEADLRDYLTRASREAIKITLIKLDELHKIEKGQNP